MGDVGILWLQPEEDVNIIPVALIAMLVGGALSRSESVVLPIVVALVVLLPALMWWSAYRALKTAMTPGAQWTSGFDEHGLMVANPAGMVVVDWRNVGAVSAGSDMVVVMTKGSRAAGFGIPAPLFPQPAVEYARSCIAAMASQGSWQ
ncbi:hypothetical protein B7435_17070 [Mycolicibacterium peregrinum]|uniref:hypothetical protein n=1 Tax=Mycolicibacterium peregrinum TaxID=43304 RepID=UPI000B4AC6AC|nr:hypothetical protein [Mycolicibacterium peregrinum]OWM01271.1 hypothetical protein B7435_17070 [Mycolicibacterium peregrinum]